jgi:hypothetical protein
LKSHIETYAGNEAGLKPDPIHKEVRKGMKLRMDRCGPPKGRMMIEKDSEAPSFLDGLVSRMKSKGMKKSIFTKPKNLLQHDGGLDMRANGSWV